MADNIVTRMANWATERDLIHSIRETVFVIEQSVDPEIEWDGEDATSQHALAFIAGNPIAATGRLQADGKIGRMAVLEEWRGRGLGYAILDQLVEAATVAGLDSVYLHAQTHAIPFYTRAGFVAEGPEFDEADIPHRLMRRELGESSMNAPATRSLSNHEEYADAVIDLFNHARREVSLFTPDLIANIYDRPALVDAVRNFATRDQNTRLRILVRSSDSIVAEGRRLLELADRLSSSIAFRKLASDFHDRADAFVTADGTHYALRRQASTWDGLYDHSRPEIARKLATEFNEMWEHSLPDPNLRRLHI